ncbi:alanine racemase [Alteromonadaceae bacterium BrNp21-10]|nr:alanine racemase [Alteromonadaceae bacterium BrNp21-10]
MSRPAQAIIDLAALRHNYRLVNNIDPASQTMAVIKANGYAHGAVEVAQALEGLAPAFGVSSIEEGLALRKAGITTPILLLQGLYNRDELQIALIQHFWIVVQNQLQLQMLTEAVLDKPLNVWLKVDTGMHRLGFQLSEAEQAYTALTQSSNVADNLVLATHLACADELDNDFTHQQLVAFKQFCQGKPEQTSIANSAGLLGWPEAKSDWDRAGLILYGASPFLYEHEIASQLQPVMTLKSGIIALRKVEKGERVGYGGIWQAQRQSLIATVSIGYADGYPRVTANGTPVLVHGQKAPIAGRVSMDMIGVDVTDIHNVAIGDEVTLWGDSLNINEVAIGAQTLSYDLLAGMPARVPRIYINR